MITNDMIKNAFFNIDFNKFDGCVCCDVNVADPCYYGYAAKEIIKTLGIDNKYTLAIRKIINECHSINGHTGDVWHNMSNKDIQGHLDYWG